MYLGSSRNHEHVAGRVGAILNGFADSLSRKDVTFVCRRCCGCGKGNPADFLGTLSRDLDQSSVCKRDVDIVFVIGNILEEFFTFVFLAIMSEFKPGVSVVIGNIPYAFGDTELWGDIFTVAVVICRDHISLFVGEPLVVGCPIIFAVRGLLYADLRCAAVCAVIYIHRASFSEGYRVADFDPVLHNLDDVCHVVVALQCFQHRLQRLDVAVQPSAISFQLFDTLLVVTQLLENRLVVESLAGEGSEE